MINTRAEREAIHAVAAFFTKYDWIFREQQVADFGIDAFVEKATSGRPDGLFFAAQIKGGEKNFHRGKKELSFYFSDVHYTYWLSVSQRIPILLFLFDPSTNEIYWQQVTENNVRKVNKRRKLSIPYSNKLTKSTLCYLEDIIKEYPIDKSFRSTIEASLLDQYDIEAKESVTTKYHLSNGRKKELLCNISDKRASETINLGYSPKTKNWDKDNNELSWEDPFFFTLTSLEKYVLDHYNIFKRKGQKRIIEVLKEEVERMAKAGGIEEIAKNMFDHENSTLGIPKYKYFIEAFEHHTGMKKREYTAHAVGHSMYFRAGSLEYEMDTYEGKTVLLRSFIENRSYDEIYTETEASIWGEIYIDAGIEKEKFVPKMLNEWERYWRQLYEEIQQKVGTTDHLDESKSSSWRQMQAFMEGYNDAGDIIEFAYNFDDLILYPIAVITMMNIFNPEVCYEEYCELEFWTGSYGWEDIKVRDEDDNSPIFHIRLSQ